MLVGELYVANVQHCFMGTPMINNFDDLADNEAHTMMKNLGEIMRIAGDMARNSVPGAHEVYVIARDSFDMLRYDVVSRDTVRKLTDDDTRFQGYTVSPDCLLYMKQGRKIDAIKQFRTESGLGLREAKDWVESFMDHHLP